MTQAFPHRRLKFALSALMKATVVHQRGHAPDFKGGHAPDFKSGYAQDPGDMNGAQPILSRATHGAFSTHVFEDALKRVISLMGQSPMGSALLRSASTYGLSVGLDPMLEPNASFHYAAQNHFDLGYQDDFLQATEKGIGRYLMSFTGALRRSWHHHRGLSLDAAVENPQDFLDHYRLMEADIAAVSHLCAWELRAQGLGFWWRDMINGIDGDIAVVFEQSLTAHPQDQFNGRALKAAFNQWFAQRARANLCDRRALELIDMALLLRAASKDRAASSSFRRDQLQHLGLLPSGRNYLAGCLFTSAWYGGLDHPDNRSHLAAIQRDISQVIVK